MIKSIKTPGFCYMGGKCRLRKWLISHFPKTGDRYIEPFAGLGNVFFQARKDMSFCEWRLNDINVGFLSSLLNENLDDIPDKMDQEGFTFWKNANNGISKIIEPGITFFGKGYKAGFNKGGPGHPPYNGVLYKIRCTEAKRLLSGAIVEQKRWDELDYDSLTQEDFVYLDPPYFGTKASYPNIDHEKLVTTLKNCKTRWALSGYDNQLYTSSLKFTNRYVKERNSEIKGFNSRKYEAVQEVLWTNY